jgi:alkanesulfonate monooxygenase SsuD/methylene tetrahydromethanopterin reductase-like flavin-dependent oxidoreductase (luciferase family)
MALKFGFLFSLRNPAQWRKPWSQVYRETLDQIVIAEQLGFDSVWLSEHHGAEDGYCPSVLPVAAAAADRTSTITIGTRLMLLPLHHPVRVAEDAAVVDIISEGRFVLGVAVGYRPQEYPAFGVNRRYRPSLIDESIEIIRRAWREDDFDFEGKRYQLKGVRVEPKPFQQDGPPIWIGATRDTALDRVARLGDGFHFVGGPQVYEGYADAMRRHDRDPRSIPVYDSRDFWLGEDDASAWDESREHLYHSYLNYARWGAEAAVADGREPGPAPAATPEEMRERSELFVGGPERIIELFEQRLREAPIDGTIMRMPPGIDHDLAVSLMTRVAEHVVPHFSD